LDKEKRKESARTFMRRRKRDHPDIHRFLSTKSGAGARGLAFELPKALGLDLITDACFYCGTPPEPVNGIDRVDNGKGYIEDNVVSCCTRCNQIKRAYNVNDFLGHAQRIAARHPYLLEEAA
jgi:hypothetical protein